MNRKEINRKEISRKEIGSTAWQTPLERHAFSASGCLSFTQPGESQGLLSYQNRPLTPTIGAKLFNATSSAQIYGSDLLLEQQRGGQLSARWPVDWSAEPYTSTTLGGRLRYADIEPIDREAFTPALGELQPPQAGQQTTATFQLMRRKRPPNRHAFVHPLDGWGLRAAVTGAADMPGGDSSFLRADLAGYQILPGVGALTSGPSLVSPSPAKEHLQRHRLFLYGRLQAQTGSSFPQDYIGLSRYDAIEPPSLPGTTSGVLSVASPERARGYRSYALRTRVALGSAEYRLPLFPSLQTRMLGAVELGKMILSAFVDGGAVWPGTDLGGATHRVGTGVELKNEVKIGPLRVGHAVGTARSALEGGLERRKVYYRVQTALPF